MTADSRLNARLTPALADRLQRARYVTKKSTTQIVHEALAAYCDAALENASPSTIVQELGLIGCVDGPADLSTRSKEYFASGLDEKVARPRAPRPARQRPTGASLQLSDSSGAVEFNVPDAGPEPPRPRPKRTAKKTHP